MQDTTNQSISVVDDDEAFLKATVNLLKSNGFVAESYSSAEEFLNAPRAMTAQCLILDVQMSGMSGLELQRHLVSEKRKTQIIFLTAHVYPEFRETAMKAGAVDFLTKPFAEEALLHAIHVAFQPAKNIP
jgi:FixJ family two-component response regulator